jgi:hypothetical protein
MVEVFRQVVVFLTELPATVRTLTMWSYAAHEASRVTGSENCAELLTMYVRK